MQQKRFARYFFVILFLLLASPGIKAELPDRAYYGKFTTRLDPETGLLPTFTRASSSSNGKVKDAFGAWQDTKANEARFHGANRVANAISDSEQFGVKEWFVQKGTVVGAALDTPNPLTPARNTILPITRSVSDHKKAAITLRSRRFNPVPHVFSLVIDGSNTYGDVKVNFVHTSDSVVVSSYVVTPLPGANRYCFPIVPVDSSNHKIEISASKTSGARKLAIGTAQLEAVYLQNPAVCNNYVPRGVPGFGYPYMGAGVDGVAYFDAVNEWTYASGNYGRVVAQTPTPLDTATTRGILLEPYASNKIFNSNNFSNLSWSKAGVVLGNKVDSAYGPSTLIKLTEDTTAGVHGISSAYCLGCSAPNSTTQSTSYSVIVKSAERNWAYLEISVGSSVLAYGYYDLLNGQVGTKAGQNVYADIWPDGDAWRISLTVDAGADYASYPGNATAKLYAALNDGVVSYQGFPGNGLYAGMAQWEINEMPTSYLGDQASSSKTRNADIFDIDLPSALVSTSSFAMSVGMTPWYFTAANSTSYWYFILYAKYDPANRFGIFFRPSSKIGGRWPSGTNIGTDYYCSTIPNFDGVELSNAFNFGDYTRAVFTFGPNNLSTDPNSVSGSAAMVGTVYGQTQLADSHGTPSTNYTALLPAKLLVGRGTVKGGGKHPMSYRDISIFNAQLTRDQVIQEASTSP